MIRLGWKTNEKLRNLIQKHAEMEHPGNSAYQDVPKAAFVYNGRRYRGPRAIAACINENKLLEIQDEKEVTPAHVTSAYKDLHFTFKFVRKKHAGEGQAPSGVAHEVPIVTHSAPDAAVAASGAEKFDVLIEEQKETNRLLRELVSLLATEIQAATADPPSRDPKKDMLTARLVRKLVVMKDGGRYPALSGLDVTCLASLADQATGCLTTGKTLRLPITGTRAEIHQVVMMIHRWYEKMAPKTPRLRTVG